MDSSDISDQILSVLPHPREPFRGSENQETEKKYKSKIQCSPSRLQLTAQSYRASKNSCQGCSDLWGAQGGSNSIYSLGFAHSQQSSWFFCLDFSVWISISDGDKVIYVTVQHADQRKGWRHQSKKKEVSTVGSCWVFLEGEMKLDLCKFKPGRAPPHLINGWILQRFYFINRKTPLQKANVFIVEELSNHLLCVPPHAAERESWKSRASCCFIAPLKISICAF